MFMRAERSKRRGEGRWYAAGPLTGAAAAAGLLLLFAFLLYRSWIPAKYMEVCALLSVFLGAAAGGARAAAMRGEGVLTCGAAAGGMLFLALLLSAWILPQGRVFSEEMLRMLICCADGGLLGGVLKMKRGKTHKRR